MDEDLIVTQIGLIFSQVRYLRMSIDQIERSTARYAGVSLDVAAAGPGQWGAPPLEGGALRVFIVNIGDLIAPDNSFLGVLSSVFRFATGAIGGVIGGAISGLALPVILAEIADITRNIVQILQLLGHKTATDKPEQGGTFMGFLDQLKQTADKLAAILGLTNAQQKSGKPPASAESQEWLQILQTADHIVKGLILLVPNLIGAFAALLVRIDGLKVLVLDLLEFLVRNVLILRGIILLTLYDTIGAAARLAGQILALLATGIGEILAAIFRMLDAIISGALAAVKFLSSALTAMVNSVLPWLVNTVFNILNGLGQLPIFRVMFAFVEMMPVVLPAVLRLANEPWDSKGKEQSILDDARERLLKDLPTTAVVPHVDKMEDFANLPGVADAFTAAATSVSNITESMRKEIPGVLGSASRMLSGIAEKMQDVIGPNGANLNKGIEAGAAAITQNANTLAADLRKAKTAAEETGGTGLKAIAKAYEAWLGQGGLNQIMGQITSYIQSTPAASEGSTALLGRVATAASALGDLFSATPMEPARPTVEINEVVIDITAATPKNGEHVKKVSFKTLDPDEEIPFDELCDRGDWRFA